MVARSARSAVIAITFTSRTENFFGVRRRGLERFVTLSEAVPDPTFLFPKRQNPRGQRGSLRESEAGYFFCFTRSSGESFAPGAGGPLAPAGGAEPGGGSTGGGDS
jgi:hypothetical protein